MNKIVKSLFVLFLSGAVLLTSCDNASVSGSTATTEPPKRTQATSTDKPTGTEGESNKPEYTELKCESAKNYNY